MNLNQITLAGNVSSDVEMRYTASGKAVTSFNMAINEGSGEKKTTLFVRVSCWEKLAEVVSQYLTKGQQVLISGRLAPSRAYARKDGELAASTEITANVVQFGAKSSKSGDPTDSVSVPSSDVDVPF